MKKVIRRSVQALVVFGLGMATGLVAQTMTDLPQCVEQKRTDLSGVPGMEVIASIVEFKPGETTNCTFIMALRQPT